MSLHLAVLNQACISSKMLVVLIYGYYGLVTMLHLPHRSQRNFVGGTLFYSLPSTSPVYEEFRNQHIIIITHGGPLNWYRIHQKKILLRIGNNFIKSREKICASNYANWHYINMHIFLSIILSQGCTRIFTYQCTRHTTSALQDLVKPWTFVQNILTKSVLVC